jgi:hypothetical protein
MLTDPAYGVGIPAAALDLDAFAAYAAYCDAPVTEDPGMPHPWIRHTHREAFLLTHELRIPRARHRLKPQPAPFLWHCYDATGRLLQWDGYAYALDPVTGDFWLRLGSPLATPLRGTIVLTGILDEGSWQG